MRKSLPVLILSFIATAPATAQQTPLDQLVNRLLGGVKTVAQSGGSATSSQGTGGGLGAQTPDQQAMLTTALGRTQSDAAIARDLAETRPLIVRLLTLTSCGKTDGALNQLNVDSLEPTTYTSDYWGSSHSVMTKGRYHDASRCYNVQRVGNWSKPAANALAFTAWYVSPVSGEAGHQDFTLQKMPDRGWLIRSIGLIFTN